MRAEERPARGLVMKLSSVAPRLGPASRPDVAGPSSIQVIPLLRCDATIFLRDSGNVNRQNLAGAGASSGQKQGAIRFVLPLCRLLPCRQGDLEQCIEFG